jgi:hypothetical protein
MKCPHCGMNIRDNIVECGYCGGKIARHPEKPEAPSGRNAVQKGATAKGAAPTRSADDTEMEDEEGGGLSAYLQPGEQVLIGSLNVSVKKFFFHAYLTNQRVFLIDTQEKKLKVTAKDVPRDTIVGSIVEFSENSDPVLVLSIRSQDDEVKTLKLVFAQSGTDRSGEIDEWIALLQEAETPKKGRKPVAEAPPEPEMEEEPEPEVIPEEPPVVTRAVKPPVRQEIHPARKPVKEHERQPPVKRIQSPYKVPEEEPEPEPEPEPVQPQRRPVIRPVTEPVKRSVISTSYEESTPTIQEPVVPQVRKPEVQTAMKVAMKGAVKTPVQPAAQPVKRMIAQPVRVTEPEPEFVPEPEPEVRQPVRRPVTREIPPELQRHEELAAESPQFCHNCGKKLPHSANFCPGCGTKLGQHRTLPHSRTPATSSDRKMTRTDPPIHEQRQHRNSEDTDEEETGEVPVPVKPPVKKAPKGSEMTILHKFLRR